LKKEAVCPSELPVIVYQATRCHIGDDGNLHECRNLRLVSNDLIYASICVSVIMSRKCSNDVTAECGREQEGHCGWRCASGERGAFCHATRERII